MDLARDRVKVNRGDIPGPFVYVSFSVDGTPQYEEFIVTTPDEARGSFVWPGPTATTLLRSTTIFRRACFDALIDESRSQHIPTIAHGPTK